MGMMMLAGDLDLGVGLRGASDDFGEGGRGMRGVVERRVGGDDMMVKVQGVKENRCRSYELHKYDCRMNIHRDKLLLLVAYMLIRTHARMLPAQSSALVRWSFGS
jgi:hypothetical protein